MSEKIRLIPKNWEQYQHYKDRKPQWIKLHRDLLNDFSYSMVRIGTKATLPLLWLLACEYEDGVIYASIEEIAFRIHIDKSTVQTAVDELIDIGYFTSDSNLVQNGTDCYPREEKRREEKESVPLFTFSLKRQTSVTGLSKEYLSNLKEYIKSSGYSLSYEDFINGLEAKGNKYKNFKSAYITWAKNYDKWNNDKKPIQKDREWIA